MKLRIWGALLVVYIVWGSTYLAIRFAVETMPPFLMAAARFLIAGLILYTWRRLAGDPAPTRRQWQAAAGVGLLLLLGGNGSVVWAEQYVTSGATSLLVGSAPLWMVILDALRPGGRRPNWRTVAGVLIGFSGIIVLISNSSQATHSQQNATVGLFVLLMGASLWASGSLYSRTARLPDSPLLGTAMEMLCGGAGLLLVGSLAGDWSRLNLASVSPASWWGLAYLVFFGSLAGFAAYTWLLRVAPTPLVATYAYVNPLIAILLGSWLANEPLTVRILLATGVILGSVLLINSAQDSSGQASKTLPVASEGVSAES